MRVTKPLPNVSRISMPLACTALVKPTVIHWGSGGVTMLFTGSDHDFTEEPYVRVFGVPSTWTAFQSVPVVSVP